MTTPTTVPLPLQDPALRHGPPRPAHGLLERRMRALAGRAINDFNMVQAGDKVMVCLSGGKDSYTLLELMLQLQRRAPVGFELVAVHLDQKQPGYPAHVLPDYLRQRGVAFQVIEQDTYSVVSRVIPEGRTMCSLCSRLRRGALYAHAAAHGFTRIALGHHRDDIVATFLLNLFFHAKLSAMPPKLLSDDGRNVVIRPLAYVAEADIAAYAATKGFPIIPCDLCGSQQNLQRRQVQAMMADWERQAPGRIDQVARALSRIEPSQLADRSFFDFIGLGAGFTASHADASGIPASSASSAPA